MYNILNESEIFTADQIARIEKMKNAKYVCETCIKTRNGWQGDEAVAIFWNKDPASIPPGGSAWFGLFYKNDPFSETPGIRPLMITNAISAVEEPIVGIIAENDDVIYSRFRHDYRRSPDGSVMIDGGRDYTRTSTCPRGMVTLKIVEGDLVVIRDTVPNEVELHVAD